MGSQFRSILLAVVAAVICGCAANPADNKPKATVGNAAEPTAAKPAQTETLAITPENSKVEFTASKVTRSHHGSFKKFSGQIDSAPNVPDSRVTVDIDASSIEAD